MKFHDRARTRRPDLSSIVPLAVLFITSLNGPTVHEAFRSSLDIFFSPVTGPILWLQAILLNVALFGLFLPDIPSPYPLHPSLRADGDGR